MQTQVITRQQVIELAATMPSEKLASWYEYGLFIQERVQPVAAPAVDEIDSELAQELSSWEAASDEDWANLESTLAESD